MSDKRKIQHEGILALINYSTLCAKKCDVLKTHDDKLGQKEVECLRICVDKVAETFQHSNEFFTLNSARISPQ